MCTFTHPPQHTCSEKKGSGPVMGGMVAAPAWSLTFWIGCASAQVRLDFLPNLDGVFIVDRTLTGPAPGVRFQPTPKNIGNHQPMLPCIGRTQ
jgi:hypothetical protein